MRYMTKSKTVLDYKKLLQHKVPPLFVFNLAARQEEGKRQSGKLAVFGHWDIGNHL